ncbi:MULTISPECIES: hypothetical protein [Rhizobium]|jgi:hypothetical protein|uniref:Uncharacterized protein n=1 Tax=Rhizobium lusitanum TaxID=293958 RepID=A0A1C3V2R5_9HYPH|nr:MULTISPECIES: hypothetical protein [Rhizobium]NRP87897.1 hypothetical protein [Ensifer adhaerens]NKJ04660.1 hypothetical protein [Rhizobium sp. SG741]NKJ37748.1 hypothetical protein [Rhizobium sp. SG570]NTJ10253.1 hypothetical protein [Rhizobium lusitanum]SCB21938.1 hypothetical protein GA0061101_104106 [Rhizobium lusitanum]
MEMNASDRDLIEVMKRYFAVKAEVEEVKSRLEAARRDSGEEIGAFYNPRTNIDHAADIIRSHALKQELARLMDWAEGWGRRSLTTNEA